MKTYDLTGDFKFHVCQIKLKISEINLASIIFLYKISEKMWEMRALISQILIDLTIVKIS